MVTQYAEVRPYCGLDTYERLTDLWQQALPLVQPLVFGAGFLVALVCYTWLARRYGWPTPEIRWTPIYPRAGTRP